MCRFPKPFYFLKCTFFFPTLFRTFFWRARGFALTLALYGSNEQIKNRLIEFYEEFEDHEWVRFYLITSLSFNHKFCDAELKNRFLEYLKNEPDELPRIALFRLLIVHGKDNELKQEIDLLQKNDVSQHVKRVVADFNKYRVYDEFDLKILDQYSLIKSQK